MGSADRYADGEYNFFCDLCGRKEKSGNGVKTWDNHYVCRYHKEARNPQDFIKGVKDNQSLPWVRSEPADQYVAGYGAPILDTFGNLLLDTDGAAIFDIT